MPSLQNVLAGIPGLAGWQAGVQQDQARQQGQLQQASTLAGLLQHAQAAEKAQRAQALDQQFSAEMAAADTPEKQIAVGIKFGGPEAAARTGASHLDRREAIAQRAQQFMQTIDLKQSDLERKRDEFMSKTEDQRQRQMFEQWFKGETLNNAKARDAANAELRRLGIAVQQQGVDAQRERIAQGQQPIVQKNEDGTVKLFDRTGNLIRDLGKVAAPSAQYQKTEQQKKQLNMDLTRAIGELETAVSDKGLIDKSTGSGAGALVDTAAGFFGKATPGAIAVGQMKPIYDLVLKMVPRFEGPQSDKDTKLYMEASGQLANPAVPNEQKKAAGKEILRLMKARKNQFVSKDMVGTEADAKPSGGVQFLGFE